MNLKKYIFDNYQVEYNNKPPKYLSLLLASFYASSIELEKFKEEFSLQDESFLGILSFILDEKNSYKISKYGYHSSEIQKKNHTNKTKPSKLPLSDDLPYEEPTKIKKKIHY